MVKAVKEYIRGEQYCIQLIQPGKSATFLKKPPNIVIISTKLAVMDNARVPVGRKLPKNMPIEEPEKAIPTITR